MNADHVKPPEIRVEQRVADFCVQWRAVYQSIFGPFDTIWLVDPMRFDGITKLEDLYREFEAVAFKCALRLYRLEISNWRPKRLTRNTS